MWPDRESDNDYLNFGEVSQLAVDILTTPAMLPVSIGVFGNWGSGKSSMLKFIEQQLAADKIDHIPVYFDAWLYQGYDDARATILEVIARELTEAARGNESLLEKTQRLVARVDGFRLMGLIAEGTALAMGIPTFGLLARTMNSAKQVVDEVRGTEDLSKKDYQEAQKVVADVKTTVSGAIKPAQSSTPPQQIDAFRKEFSEILNELKKPLIVTIDNLDRCLPVNAIHTLEAIRLFLFLPNTAFIIAADEEMIRAAVAEHFNSASERHQIDYVDKLIQVPIRVPKAGIREIRSYMFMLYASLNGLDDATLGTLRQVLEDSLQKSWQEEPITKEAALAAINQSENENLITEFELAERIAPILATSPLVQGNPRIVKRLLNVVKLRAKTAKRRKIPLDESIITKLVIFERCAGVEATAELYTLIDSELGKPKALRVLEEYDGDSFPDGLPESWSKNSTTKSFVIDWGKLVPSLKEVDLRGALYLSRETMPLGAYIAGLSPQGREALQALARTTIINSPTAQGVVSSLALKEQVLVMEGLITHFRQISDWNNQPPGFAGACLLAQHSSEAGVLLRRFVNVMNGRPIWMTSMIKDMNWYEDK